MALNLVKASSYRLYQVQFALPSGPKMFVCECRLLSDSAGCGAYDEFANTPLHDRDNYLMKFFRKLLEIITHEF